MAVYRHIHIDYWQDGFVLDLTPEEKYFYIYLMTNSKTSQCGIYELPKRIIKSLGRTVPDYPNTNSERIGIFIIFP